MIHMLTAQFTKPRAHGFTASTGFIPLERYVAVNGGTAARGYATPETVPALGFVNCAVNVVKIYCDWPRRNCNLFLVVDEKG